MVPFVIGVVIGILLTVTFIAVLRMKEDEEEDRK